MIPSSKNKKPKITIFHCGFIYSGGGERIVLEEAKGLKKRGYEVEVFAPHVDRRECFPDLIKQIGVKTLLPQLPDWFPFRDGFLMIVTSVFAPLFFYRFQKTDLFFGANQPGAWLAYCISKILKKPYLVYLNQPNRLLYPRKIDQKTGWQTRPDYYLLAFLIKKIKPLVAWLDRLSFTSASAMLVNGGYIKKAIEKIYQKKTVDAPAGSYYQPLSRLKLKPNLIYQGKINLGKKPIKKPYLLITNRHQPQKKFDCVIRAFSKLIKKFPKTSLVIPGPFTSYTQDIIELAKKINVSDQVIYPGKINEKELQRLYSSAAVYCYPSPDEDFGLGPLEAGGWGVPTVAWRHGGPTVTVEDGISGFLAKPYQVSDYADKILKLLKNPKLRVKMGRAAWQRTKNRFSWKHHLDILEREISSLLSQEPIK